MLQVVCSLYVRSTRYHIFWNISINILLIDFID